MGTRSTNSSMATRETLSEFARRVGTPANKAAGALDGSISLDDALDEAIARASSRDVRPALVVDLGDEFRSVALLDLVRAQSEQARRDRAALAARVERAENDARQRADFIASISHEIRTPMTALMGYAELLGDEELSPDDRSRMIASLRRSGEHLLGIVNDVLDFSKLDAGKMGVTLAEASPAQIVDDVAALLRERAESKGLVFETSCDGLPERVRTDALRLRQILLNIVGNAIKFTQSGHVAINASVDMPGGALVFVVRDTGVGIPPDRLHDIFEPFAQLEGQAHARQRGFSRGTGLGLTISRRLARLLGGDIEVSSTPGGGSVFTARVAMDSAAPAHTASSGHLAGMHVLIVEDGPDNSALFATILRRAGAHVTIAADGREGVEVALRPRQAKERFGLIIMDIDMPGVDGVRAAGEIRAKACTTPILAITAHSAAGLREACIASGCDDLLHKPIRREAFIAACERTIAARVRRVAS